MGLPLAQITSSMSALMGQYEVITANLANVSTPAFKRRSTLFQQELQKNLGADGTGPAPKITSQTRIDFNQGNLVETGRSLDAAIQGPGFYTLETPNGPLYTRNGTFAVNANRQLVDPSGVNVAGSHGPIIIPPGVSASQVSIASDGTVSAGTQYIDTLKLTEFKDPSLLKPVSGNCYAAPAGVEGTAAQNSQLVWKFQESSNVSVVDELVNLITVSRMYESNAKTIAAQDDKGKSLLQVAMA